MEQFGQGIFVNAGANDTKPSGGAGTAAANVRCTRYIVEVDPAAVLCRYNALGTEDHAVLVCVFQSRQSVGDLLLGVLPGRLYAPAGEHFVCMVVVMLVIVVMAAAGAVLVMFVVIMVEQWMESKNRPSVLIGLGCGLVCLLIFGADNFILPTMICIMLILLPCRKFLDKETEQKKEVEHHAG